MKTCKHPLCNVEFAGGPASKEYHHEDCRYSAHTFYRSVGQRFDTLLVMLAEAGYDEAAAMAQAWYDSLLADRAGEK